MAQKTDNKIEDIKILTKISTRLDNIENKNVELAKTQIIELQKQKNQRERHKNDIARFQDNCKEIDIDLKNLKKNIFEIGKKLKDKVSNDELEFLSNEVDQFKFEEYLPRTELKKTYNRYSQQE